ncbi:MAG: penicillin-binding transpeptidase domain-containing protein [Carboxydocellales bacterium]
MDYLRGKRVVWVFGLFFALFIPLMYRLGYLQLIKGGELARKAWEQSTQRVVLESNERGNIFDRNLRSLLDSHYQMRVVAFPSLVVEKDKVAQLLAPIIGIAEGEIAKRLKGKPAYWPEELTSMQQLELAKLELPGIMVRPLHERYGNRPLATNTLGYLGKIASNSELGKLRAKTEKRYSLADLVGRSGLEYYYEAQLKGSKPEKAVLANVNANGQLIKGLGFENIDQGSDRLRNNLVLTLDRPIQEQVEETMDRWQMRGAVVVMDVGTGDLLALASRPTFRPDKLKEYLELKEDKMFLDQTILLTEPGSVFKVIIAAAALEEGLVSPETRYKCLATDPVPCNIAKPHLDHSITEAMADSCNPTFVKLGLALGAERIIEYARRFGLDNQKVIGYPNQADGRQNWAKVQEDPVNSSIGQGPVLTSPVEITAMLNTIANKGIYIEPRLVRELRSTEGNVLQHFPLGISHRAVSTATAKKVEDMLVGVTLHGTGRKAALTKELVAGKTGSAQPGNAKGTTNAWFSGYFPVGKPQYVITVFVQNGVSGGESAAPVFRELAQGLLPSPQ